MPKPTALTSGGGSSGALSGATMPASPMTSRSNGASIQPGSRSAPDGARLSAIRLDAQPHSQLTAYGGPYLQLGGSHSSRAETPLSLEECVARRSKPLTVDHRR